MEPLQNKLVFRNKQRFVVALACARALRTLSWHVSDHNVPTGIFFTNQCSDGKDMLPCTTSSSGPAIGASIHFLSAADHCSLLLYSPDLFRRLSFIARDSLVPCPIEESSVVRCTPSMAASPQEDSVSSATKGIQLLSLEISTPHPSQDETSLLPPVLASACN